MRRIRRYVFVVCLAAPTALGAQSEADVAWNAGDHTTAERLYLERLSADSADQGALHRVALIHGWSERYQSSIQYFDRLLAVAPENTAAAMDRARVLGWSRRYDEAIAGVGDVLEDDPGNLDALRLQAQIAGWAGEFPQAIATYDRLLELVPDDLETRRNQARVLTWATRRDEAMSIYEGLLEQDPNDRETLLGFAQLLAWNGRLDSAATLYDNMLDVTPGDSAALIGRARVASWSGELGTGEDLWRAILAAQPENVEALVGLSQTLRWQGRHGAALDVLEKALAIDPTNPDVLTQERWTRASINPRTSGNLSYEGDSDGNRIVTGTLRAAWRPTSRLEISGHGYRRTAGFNTPFVPKRTTNGVSATLWAQAEPGWTFSATAGVSESNALTAEPIGSFRLGVGSPRRNNVSANVSFSRTAFDYTAPLIEQGVYFLEWRGTARTLLPHRVTLTTTVAHAIFNGTNRNHRTLANATIIKRITTPVTIGANVQVFGFTQDLNDGYFDPNFYGLAEGLARWQRTISQKWTLFAELAPGLQQVRTDGSFGATVRTTGRIAYGISPGRQISVSGVFASTGIQSFSTEPGSYRYRAVTFGGTWMF